MQGYGHCIRARDKGIFTYLEIYVYRVIHVDQLASDHIQGYLKVSSDVWRYLPLSLTQYIMFRDIYRYVVIYNVSRDVWRYLGITTLCLSIGSCLKLTITLRMHSGIDNGVRDQEGDIYEYLKIYRTIYRNNIGKSKEYQ